MPIVVLCRALLFTKRCVQAGSLQIEMKKMQYDIIVAREIRSLPQNN